MKDFLIKLAENGVSNRCFRLKRKRWNIKRCRFVLFTDIFCIVIFLFRKNITTISMFPVEQYKFINEVVEKITVHIDRVEIEYKTDGLEAVITEMEASNGQLSVWSMAISK